MARSYSGVGKTLRLGLSPSDTTPRAWLNGRALSEPPVGEADCSLISLSEMISDRGLHYGHGLFETIRVLPGLEDDSPHFCLFPYHMRRMALGIERLSLAPRPDEIGAHEGAILGGVTGSGDDTASSVTHQQLLSVMLSKLLAQNSLLDTISREVRALPLSGAGVLKIIVTAGTAERGYACPDVEVPKRLYFWFPKLTDASSQAAISTGLSALICDNRLSINPSLAGIKHLNRLEQVLGANEVARAGMDDGIMLDPNGQVIETTASNIFLVRGQKLLTPDLHHCGVSGVLRSAILDTSILSKTHKIDVEAAFPVISVGPVSLDDLWSADEVFVTNCVRGIRPILTITRGGKTQKTFPRGPVTQRLQAWHQLALRQRLL